MEGALLNRANDDRAGYTGHVMDSGSGLIYMQQRYYDPGIGRFLSVDPVAAFTDKGILFNRYWYANGNPYRYIDPDGRIVYVKSKFDRERVVRWINKQAKGQFSFDSNGHLQVVSMKGSGSTYYQRRLIEAINSPATIVIQTGSSYTARDGTTYTTQSKGGALTDVAHPDGRINVVINTTQQPNQPIRDVNDNVMHYTAADKLRHELLAHAIPAAATPDTGNGIEHENKARAEIGDVLRFPEYHEE